jgi:hypothetical protein
MTKLANIGLVAIAGALLTAAVAFSAEQKSGVPAATVPHYSEVLAAPKGVSPAHVKVEIKDLYFVRNEQGIKLPASGFYIAQLKSGQIDTEVAGNKEHRRAGDFWTVAVGQTMTVRFPAHSQAAQIRTIAVGP